MQLREYNNRVVLFGSTSNASYFYAYEDNGTQFTLVHSYISTEFNNTPVIKVSPELSKLAILGYQDNNSSDPKLLAVSWHLNYTTHTSKEIVFPTELVRSVEYTEIILIEEWIYLRQLQGTN